MSNWYVIWVLTGQEERVLRDIRHAPGVKDTMVPMQELPYRVNGAWETRRSVMIPGYVFVECRMDAALYHLIKGSPSVIGWLGPDSMWPTDVPDDEMDRVKQLSAGCDPSRILHSVKLDRHKRRGRGTLKLCGKEQQIIFPYPMEVGLPNPSELTNPVAKRQASPSGNAFPHKQPDEARVDERPAADEGDQMKDAEDASPKP